MLVMTGSWDLLMTGWLTVLASVYAGAYMWTLGYKFRPWEEEDYEPLCPPQMDTLASLF